MKPLTLYFVISLNIFSTYALGYTRSFINTSNEEVSDELTRNLTTLVYRSLSIYKIDMRDLKSSSNIIVPGKKLSSSNYNYFLDASESRGIWTPLLKVSHEFGLSITKTNRWFNHLLQPWDGDLRIDYLSGYILGKLGASLEDTQETFTILVDQEEHDKKNLNNKRRCNALISGHYRALYGY